MLRKLTTGYNPQLWILFAGWIISAMGFAMVIPFISIYFHTELGISMTAVGGFFFVTAIVRAVSQIIAGNLSDSLGRRKIMIFAQFFRAVVFFGVALSIQYRLGFLVTASILVLGYLLASFFQPVANAMVTDIVPEKKRTEAFGFLRVAANIGWGIGPALGGFLAKNSYSNLFWAGGILAFLSGLTIFLFIKESNLNVHPASPINQLKNMGIAFKDKRFMQFSFILLLTFLTMAQLIATLSVYAKEYIGLNNVQLGWVYSVNAGTVVLFQIFVARMTRGRNLVLVLALGSFMYGVGYGMMSIPESLMGILCLIVFITTAEMMVGPSASTSVSLMAPTGKHGLYMGAFGLFGTFGWSAGPFIGGVLLDHVENPVILWLCVSSFGFLGALGFLWMNHKYPELRNDKKRRR